MNKLTIKSKLDESIEMYRTEVNMLFAKNSSEPATKGDLEELSRQVFYVFTDMQKCLENL